MELFVSKNIMTTTQIWGYFNFSRAKFFLNSRKGCSQKIMNAQTALKAVKNNKIKYLHLKIKAYF